MNHAWSKGLSALLLSALIPASSFAQIEKISDSTAADYRSKLPEVQKMAVPGMKALLSSLDKKDEAAVINAVRVANDMIAAGMKQDAKVLHYAVPAMSEYQRLADTYPLDGSFQSPVRIIAAGDEYEPGSFVVYPLENLGKVEFRLTPFKNKDGKVFDSANLDLKVIKVWYQNGNGWYSYFGDTGLKLTPELLLNDEDLIEVDTENEQNYARVTEKDGSVSKVWLTPPLEFDKRHDHWREVRVFQPMKEHFQDAETLQPVTLNRGEFKQFFLTVHVPANTSAGLYSGNVEMIRNGGKIGEIPVTIRVLPYNLPAPKTYYDVNKDFLTASYSYISLAMIAEENGGDYVLAEKQLEAVLRNQAEHNQKMHWVGRSAPGTYEFDLTVDTMKKVGMMTDPLISGWSVGSQSESAAKLARNAKIYRNFFDKNVGHHNVFIGHGDEPSANWVINQRPLYEAYQNEGFRFIIAGQDQVFFSAGYIYDFFNTATQPENAEATRKWNEVGHAWVAWYANHHVGPENPAYNRRQYGLAPYLANYSATCNYAHHFGPYNDRREVYKPMVFAYGVYDGVIDTLAWEGYREGIDDIRYATLLKTMAKQILSQTDDLQEKYAARQALQFLSEINLTGDNLNTVRLEIIEYIGKLRTILNNKQ